MLLSFHFVLQPLHSFFGTNIIGPTHRYSKNGWRCLMESCNCFRRSASQSCQFFDMAHTLLKSFCASKSLNSLAHPESVVLILSLNFLLLLIAVGLCFRLDKNIQTLALPTPSNQNWTFQLGKILECNDLIILSSTVSMHEDQGTSQITSEPLPTRASGLRLRTNDTRSL